MLRWLPSHKHFRSSIIEIKDLCEKDIAEQKLRPGNVITKNGRIAKYSPFIGPAGILRSTERIIRLVNSDFDSKHPIKLDARHAVVRLWVKNLHVRNFYQGLDYIRKVVNLNYVVLKLRWLL